MSNENLRLWDSVEKTNPKYTKSYSSGGQNRTTVDAQHKKKMITEAFGPYGKGWGVVAGSEFYDRIHYDDECETVLLNYLATAFYVLGSERYEFPIAAQAKEAYRTKQGKGYKKIDDEAVKKVRTDALTKGFTELGFCADIHMGMFDDQDYVHGAMLAANVKEAERKEEKQQQQYAEIKKWIETEVLSAKTISTFTGFEKAIKRIIAKTITRCDAAGLPSVGFETKLNETINTRKKEDEQNAI